MKVFNITPTVCFALLCATNVSAQTGMTLRQIGGKSYYTYETKSKQTLYGVAQQVQLPQELLLTYNPWASRSLDKNQLILVPADAVGSTHEQQPGGEYSVAGASEPVSHVMEVGETVCSIAKRFNASVEGILAANPRLKPEDYVPGTVVRVKPGSAMPFAYEKSVTVFDAYTVQPGETYALLAHRSGYSVTDLQTLNPGVKKPKKGKTLVMPTERTERRTGEMATVSLDDLEAYYGPRLGSLYEAMLAERRNSDIHIAMLLPFQLHKSAPPKQAYLYTDFYKGFLLALDSLKNTGGRKVHLHVYDTEHNLNVTDSLLALPQLREMTVLIAPSEPKQLERVNTFGLQAGIDVLNCFSTKNEDYLTNPYVYAVNTPTSHFTAGMLRWFDKEFADCSVIFLEDPDASGKEMYGDIRSHITSSGIPSETLTVGSELNFDKLSRVMNPGTRYVVIPSSSSKELLRKVVKSLKRAKDERFDCDLALLGYPEYVLYLKDYQNDLQDIDTYMFSRFFNAKGYRSRDFDTLYRRWFGGDALPGYPHMGLLGYDTGMFLVNSLRNDGALGGQGVKPHKGIQTPFRFERDNERGGYVNEAFDVVHFTPEHTIITEMK